MTRALLACCLALALAACAKEPPAPSLADLPDPPAEWLAPAEPLRDIPACTQASRVARLSCRADYDADTRSKYVQLAGRHAAVAGWIRVAKSRIKKAG